MTEIWMIFWALFVFMTYKLIDNNFFKPKREAKRKAESKKKIDGMILKALVDADVDPADIVVVTKLMAEKEANGVD